MGGGQARIRNEKANPGPGIPFRLRSFCFAHSVRQQTTSLRNLLHTYTISISCLESIMLVDLSPPIIALTCGKTVLHRGRIVPKHM